MFIAVDVETADSWPGSICQIGLVEMVGGRLVRNAWLVNPCRPFLPINTSIHGLNATRTAGFPTFRDLHPIIFAALNNKIVASYTDFDARALGSACIADNLPFPIVSWLDVRAVAVNAWPDLAAHNLREVGGMLGIRFNENHDAEQDALATAYVLLKGLGRLGLTVETAKARFALQSVTLSKPHEVERGRYEVGAWADVFADCHGVPDTLAGASVVFTGDMPFDRQQMADLVAKLGGTVRNSVSKKTTLIVSGWERPELGGQKLKSAADRIMDGQRIRYCTGHEFAAIVERMAR